MERLMTLAEVCHTLGCTDPKGRYVRRLRDKGLLEAARFGRNLMFTEESVNRFVEEQFRLQKKRTS